MNIIGKIVIAPVKSLIEELAGSLSLPKRWEGKTIDEIIQDAKAEHFNKIPKQVRDDRWGKLRILGGRCFGKRGGQ